MIPNQPVPEYDHWMARYRKTQELLQVEAMLSEAERITSEVVDWEQAGVRALVEEARPLLLEARH